MSFNPADVTVDQFKARFYRDFTYANQNPNQQQPLPPASYDTIQDLDIDNAFTDAQSLFNCSLFASDTASLTGYLLLSAHCLCQNISAADASVNSGGSFPVSGRSVGSVSENYMIPDAYKNSPVIAMYSGTKYGMKYLQMVLPAMTGNMVALPGYTNP